VHLLGDFYEIFSICGKLYARSSSKIQAHLLSDVGSYGALNLRGAFSTKISAKPYFGWEDVLEVQK